MEMIKDGIGYEFEVAKLLEQKKLHVTTAESCTGGLIAGTLVNVPGISAWFGEGYVTYSNQAKEKLLGVSHETLEVHGAVSAETAEEMAEGAAKAAGADVAVVSTGIAGPDGGTAEKPVGLVYIGCFCKGTIRVEKHIFEGDRAQVRTQSVQAALLLLKTMLEKVDA
ncbi:MAG: CinA family protein [Lachnospiraceae bacterium]|nr:CinA family protein [Lachnospiraceae bacterium]MDD7178027.1 CinA family protein [bacterium]MDY5518334.1 CinA family protein [Lachnospiraceae bacterium]